MQSRSVNPIIHVDLGAGTQEAGGAGAGEDFTSSGATPMIGVFLAKKVVL